jgi:transcriptional regulator with XRE-family HTH domain
MTQVAQLMSTIKRLLKARGLTYRDVGDALRLSEPSIKRLFAGQRMTLDRLAQVAELLGCTLAELLEEAAVSAAPQVHVLAAAQEARLVADTRLLLVMVCALNHWSPADIVGTYRLTKAECLKQLLTLDRMGVISLLPGDRIRPRVARDFEWLPHGPIRRYFAEQGLPDFLDGWFSSDGELMEFAQGMLTQEAHAEYIGELKRLRAKLAALHMESRLAPLTRRRGTGVLMAMRVWEPAAFRALRRTPA